MKHHEQILRPFNFLQMTFHVLFVVQNGRIELQKHFQPLLESIYEVKSKCRKLLLHFLVFTLKAKGIFIHFEKILKLYCRYG